MPALSASDRLWAALPVTSWGAFESWEKKQLRFAHPSAVLPSAPLLSSQGPPPYPSTHPPSCRTHWPYPVFIASNNLNLRYVGVSVG